VGTVLLCLLFLAAAVAGAIFGAKLGAPPKRISLAAIGATSLLIMLQPPAWLADWRRALGEQRARLVLLLTTVLAFVMAFAPVSWLRVLAG
jgi:hypothetical protein